MMTNANAIDTLMDLLNQDTNNPNLRPALDLGICALKGLDVMQKIQCSRCTNKQPNNPSEAEIKLEKIREIAFSVSKRKMSQHLSFADLAQANFAAIYKIVEIFNGGSILDGASDNDK